ncbi:MAG: hypothetical protein ABW101_12335 [Candidatus Thiodiazotropha sp.]
MKWLKRLFSRRCCGGPVLAMTLLCFGFGVLFLFLSAYRLGLVFIAVGALSELLCLYLGRSRCQRRFDTHRLTG